MFYSNYFTYTPLQLIKPTPINKQINDCGTQFESNKAKILWDVDILFKYFGQQRDNGCLSENILTQKLLVLMLLFSVYRISTVKLFSVNYMVLSYQSHFYQQKYSSIPEKATFI